MPRTDTREWKSAARERARTAARAKARRKARLARAGARSPILLAQASNLRPHEPAPDILTPQSLQSGVLPADVFEPVARQIALERGPRFALIAGAAAVLAVMLALPSTCPQWLILSFTPQTRVYDLTPATVLAARNPLDEVQAVAGADSARRAGDEGINPARVPAAPVAVETSPPDEAPAVAAAAMAAASGQPVADIVSDDSKAETHIAAVGSAGAALQGEPAGGTISALATHDDGDMQRSERMVRCELELSDTAVARVVSPPAAAEGFGKALAKAALQQTRGFGVYADSYRRIAFPMGDVPALFGVCTDVIIRAYRALGIDLQARVHAARVGVMDPSIAHRRTYTLRRYFASRAASLPITYFAEDYVPGDIVTYYRPQNSGSKDHIAIVADQIGPSGRPMIIHNRGWGAQIEDALFVDKITGHYRYSGTQAPISKIWAARLGPAGKANRTRPLN